MNDEVAWKTEAAPPAMGSETHAVAVSSRSLWGRYLKRCADVLCAVTCLALVSPVLLASMLAVKLTSRGPVFFAQVRTGRRGVDFQPLKLRTMVTTHVHRDDEIVPLQHSGITPVGKLLRRTKIDELPQLFNVLKGDMALVGPRPTLPAQTREYDDFARQRLDVRPGLTGLAQVNGNASISWAERIKYDVHYVQHHDLAMDLSILFKTVLVVLFGEERYARSFCASSYGGGR